MTPAATRTLVCRLSAAELEARRQEQHAAQATAARLEEEAKEAAREARAAKKAFLAIARVVGAGEETREVPVEQMADGTWARLDTGEVLEPLSAADRTLPLPFEEPRAERASDGFPREVLAVMKPGEWYSQPQLAELLGCSVPSAGAALKALLSRASGPELDEVTLHGEPRYRRPEREQVGA